MSAADWAPCGGRVEGAGTLEMSSWLLEAGAPAPKVTSSRPAKELPTGIGAEAD